MLKRFCNKCGKEITSEDRYRMVISIHRTDNGVESEIYNGEMDYCKDCMASLSIIGDAKKEEKTEGFDCEEVKPEDC